MINQDQMEEWLREVEERPLTGAIIVRFVINRLRDLTERNEELLSENIVLRSGQRVEEYERRIANLEYQLDLLRRQFGGELPSGALNGTAVEAISFILYTPAGKIMRIAIPTDELQSQDSIIQVQNAQTFQDDGPVRLISTHQHEELLFVFDTGRTVTLPVASILTTQQQGASWQSSSQVEPHSGEQLVAALPIGKMSLFDYAVQVSRRGCAKKMMRNSFEQHISKNYIGSGIKAPPDRTCCLTLCSKDDRLVIATREGFVACYQVGQLAYTIEEVLKLYATDYLINAFVIGQKPSLLLVTNNGKAINRETTWLETAASFKSKGQALLNQSRRDAGIRVVGASAVDENDWGVALHSEGRLTVHKAADLFSTGSIPTEGELLDFTTFTL